MGAMKDLDILLAEAIAAVEAGGARLRSATDRTRGALSKELRGELLGAAADVYDAGIDALLEIKRKLSVEDDVDEISKLVDGDPWESVKELSAQVAALTATVAHENPVSDEDDVLDLDNLPEPTGQTLEIIMNTGEIFQIENVDGFVLKLDTGEWPVGWLYEDEPEDNPNTVRKAGYWDQSGEWHAFDTRYRDPRTQGMF